MGDHMELGVANPLPPLKAPTVSGHLQQAFWGCVEAGEKLVFGVERLAVARSCDDDLNDSACAHPLLTDVLRRLFRSQRPGDDTTIDDLLIHCEKRDLAFPLELPCDLAMQGSLFGFDREEEVNPLLLQLSKKGFWVCMASAWMSKPCRSSSPSSCLSTARSSFSPVA